MDNNDFSFSEKKNRKSLYNPKNTAVLKHTYVNIYISIYIYMYMDSLYCTYIHTYYAHV